MSLEVGGSGLPAGVGNLGGRQRWSTLGECFRTVGAGVLLLCRSLEKSGLAVSEER